MTMGPDRQRILAVGLDKIRSALFEFSHLRDLPRRSTADLKMAAEYIGSAIERLGDPE